jgi:hypothetical protein
MTDLPLTRRDALVATLAAAGALATTAEAATPPAALTGHEHDWDWLVGAWNVEHRQLTARLAGATDWLEFTGTSRLWLTMGGLGTVDDNWLDTPRGAYRAMGVRAFDAKTGLWSIWWVDPRNLSTLEPPVRGGFKDGVGLFSGADTFNGRPIVVRYTWSEMRRNSAHWEQAFSPDGGATWETNWRMDFTRA